jgi:peptide/nickel transport system permease protein
MVGEAAVVLHQQGFFLFITGGTIGVMTVAFGLIGDGARDLISDSKGRSAPPSPRSTAGPADETRPEQGRDLVLQVSNLAVEFTTAGGGVVRPVKNISFDVAPGEIFGLVGESGSGKTVTAHALLGLIARNGRIAEGHAWLDDEDLARLPQKEFARRIRGRQIGLVSQEPMVALDPLFTIGSQLCEVVTRIGGVRGRAARQRAIELLASVRLPEPELVMARYPHELSGGMLQRIVIAMAIAGSPRLLIADEPTTALDVTVQAGILDLLRDLRSRLNMSVILVTHDLAVVADICDRAIVMQKGRIVEEASVEDLFYRPQHPYTQDLVSKTPSIVRTAR